MAVAIKTSTKRNQNINSLRTITNYAKAKRITRSQVYTLISRGAIEPEYIEESPFIDWEKYGAINVTEVLGNPGRPPKDIAKDIIQMKMDIARIKKVVFRGKG